MSNTLPDIPRLYTALAEWLACMVYIQALPRRFHGWRMGLWAGAGLAALTAFLILTGDLPIGFWLPCMAAAVLLMLGLLAGCCRISPRGCGLLLYSRLRAGRVRRIAGMAALLLSAVEPGGVCMDAGRPAGGGVSGGVPADGRAGAAAVRQGRRTGSHLAGAERGCHHRCGGVCAE